MDNSSFALLSWSYISVFLFFIHIFFSIKLLQVVRPFFLFNSCQRLSVFDLLFYVFIYFFVVSVVGFQFLYRFYNITCVFLFYMFDWLIFSYLYIVPNGVNFPFLTILFLPNRPTIPYLKFFSPTTFSAASIVPFFITLQSSTQDNNFFQNISLNFCFTSSCCSLVRSHFLLLLPFTILPF